MIDAEIKAAMELSLINNFSSVDVLVPPTLNDVVTFSTVIRQLNQSTLDELMDSDEVLVIIGIDYPTMDSSFARNLSDFQERVEYYYLDVEQLPAASDYLRVDGVTTASFSFQVTEPRISKISIFTKPVAGSSSWLDFVLKDVNGAKIFSKIIFSTDLLDEDWIDIEIDIPVIIDPVSGQSNTYYVEISENTFGSNPIGVDIGKNGVNIAYRVYYSRYSEIVGKINLGTMRISVFSINKDLYRNPEPDFFVPANDIVTQVTKQIRQFIWSNWTEYGLNDISSVTLNEGETSNTTPYEVAITDVVFVVNDFGTIETPSLSLKHIKYDIKHDVRGL